MTNTEEINKIPDQRIIDLADAILPALESGTYTIKEKAVEIAIFVLQAGYLPSPALVRPLVWEEVQPGKWEAKGKLVGTYQIYCYPEEEPQFWLYIDGPHSSHDTLEEAKTAAQNHFNTLIASCLQGGGYTEEDLKKAQLAILCNQKDAAMNENYIIEYLTALKQQ